MHQHPDLRIRELSILLFLAILISCKGDQPSQLSDPAEAATVLGETMGTYYSVKIYDSNTVVADLKKDLDSILRHVNLALSTYIDTSLISRINQKQEEVIELNSFNPLYVDYFTTNYRVAQEVYEQSEGYYDPTVMPLVNYWGFGYQGRNKSLEPDQQIIDSLLQLVGLDQVSLKDQILTKSEHTQLDFSSLAKGFGVDVLMDHLRAKGFDNLMVDIGGEVKASGGGRAESGWNIGVAKPEEGSAYQELEMVLNIYNKAIASSGNYINFYQANGQKFVHTIDPTTGYTKQSSLLGATVIMADCIAADAWATAFMSMGLDRSRQLANNMSNMDVLLIYNENESLKYFMTKGFKSHIID